MRLGTCFASSAIGLPTAKSKFPRIQATSHHRAGVPAMGIDVSYSPDDSMKQAGVGQAVWLLAHKSQTFLLFLSDPLGETCLETHVLRVVFLVPEGNNIPVRS